MAESFYWMGRYLERAHHQAYLISVIETLETEELNSAERKHYRPMWNRLLPPLEKSAGTSRRSIANRLDRYRLVLLPEPGSVVSTFLRAMRNAESVQDSLSPEAWATHQRICAPASSAPATARKSREAEAVRITRRMADFATQLIPQFFAVAANTMLADDGWRFCEIGQMLERAIITANSVLSISAARWSHARRRSRGTAARSNSAPSCACSARATPTGASTRCAPSPSPVLELLWQHPEVPRSVRRCLRRCRALLRESIAPSIASSAAALTAIEALLDRVQNLDWSDFICAPLDEDHIDLGGSASPEAHAAGLERILRSLLDETLAMHTLIADSFLNHQAQIAQHRPT